MHKHFAVLWHLHQTSVFNTTFSEVSTISLVQYSSTRRFEVNILQHRAVTVFVVTTGLRSQVSLKTFRQMVKYTTWSRGLMKWKTQSQLRTQIKMWMCKLLLIIFATYRCSKFVDCELCGSAVSPKPRTTEDLVSDVVEKTSTGRRSRIPCVVVEKIMTRRRTFNKNSCDLLTAITHTKILVAI